jgi:hypothetical protein
MTWAQRLKRVLKINIETCTECGGCVKVIARIEDPVVVKKILTHLQEKATSKQSILAREPGAAAGWLVRLTSMKPNNQLKYPVAAFGNAAGCLMS